MTDTMDLRELPFAVRPSHPGIWWRDPASAAVVVEAPGHTDFYVNPNPADSADAGTTLNATTLLGVPPAGDFQLHARVQVNFAAQFDAGVLFLWADEQHWAKLCFELSPAGQPMVVSVVTRKLSDDANAFVVADQSVWLRVSRVDSVYAYHASLDGNTWELVRVFHLDDDVAEHLVGLEAQSPTGEGCRVTFDELRFTSERLVHLRDGS